MPPVREVEATTLNSTMGGGDGDGEVAAAVPGALAVVEERGLLAPG